MVHAQNVRSSYTQRQAPCTIIGWRSCAISVHDWEMPSQAELLRLHREARGLTLERVAFTIEQLATLRGVPKDSKSVPRTHASLSRWENGRVQIKELGLQLYAEALGATVEELRKPPPPPNARPTRTIEVDEAHAEMVDAFLKAMNPR